MNLKHLSNEALNNTLKSLVRQESELLSKILYHIAEVERRKLYLKMGYTNLYLYLEQELGYLGGSAQRYKDAALLLMDVPVLATKMESGEISLAQVSLLQRSVRAKKGKVTRQEKQDLIEDLCGQTFAESQQTVAQTLDLPMKTGTKITTQKDGSVRMEVTFTKDQWAKMTEMRELLSTSLPCGDWDQTFEYVADKVIKQKRTQKKQPKQSDGVTPAIRKFVLNKDKCCQHKNQDVKTCGSRWNLQVDHIIPVWAGGTSEFKNLRAICANHNRYRYKEQAGFTKKNPCTLDPYEVNSSKCSSQKSSFKMFAPLSQRRVKLG